MKILLGSIYVSESKSYALPFFEEMCDKLPEVDVVVAADNEGATSLPTIQYTGPASHFATAICFYGKRLLGEYALENGYDALVWQGIDCYYSCREEFVALVEVAALGHDIVGGLVAGRNMPDYPVCREFITEGDWISTHEKELPREFFDSREPVNVRGYIGSDATIISRRALEEVDMSTYEHWHERMARGEHALGPDEWFMREALKNGITPVCHTGVRPWHLHENMSAVRLFGEREQWLDMRK